MESTPVKTTNNVQGSEEMSVKHRGRYTLPDSFLNEIINIRGLKKIAENVEEPLRTLLLSQPDEMTREEFLTKGGEWWKLLELGERSMPDIHRSRKYH